MTNIRRARHRQSGLTLIEVLVAILIFSFGLLGFVGLQARAIQYSVSAEDTNRAALLANDIGSTMMVLNKVDPADALLAPEYAAWQARVAAASSAGLPNSTGTVTLAGNVAKVTIEWRAPSATASAANSINRYVTEVLLP